MPKQGLASIGIEVTINSVAMNYVKEIGDIGGAPSDLDATCLKDKMKKTVPGVQDVDAFEITYLFDNSDATSDYRVLKALQDAGDIVPVTVTIPDGTTFATTGYINTVVSGVGVDELMEATASVSLQSDWTVTNPSEA
ncbi:MAG: phage tail protein [Clostridiales bacterium]|nr:phage tail protein [Clostridiales bacterium]